MAQGKKKKIKVYNTKKKHTPESKIIETLRSQYPNIDETKLTKFTDLPLSEKTLKGLKDGNYVVLTDIQRQSIGLALQGNDILGAAKTGSGKTLAFLIPILEILYSKQWTRLDGLGALVITPTRELAYQIYETLRRVGQYHDISAGLIIGGKDLNFEKKRMNQCNIVICTPGRLLQHMDENPLFDCVNMQILVLDEADRCLDMGFERTMNSIIENLPPQRQTLLFSATQTKSVRDLARLSLKDPMYVSVHEHAQRITPDSLQQSYIVCELRDKLAMLWSFIRNHLKQKIIVFLSSCKQVKYVYEAFCRLRPGVSLLALYGTLHQLRRMDIYESFCKKQHAILFATDIAARGLDFPTVNWVVQMDCPEDVNAYIHRAGRTARFQRGGESLLVLLPSELEMAARLKEHRIPINMIQINPNKLQSPQRKLEALLARDVSLKESAQRAFVAYVKSVFLMKDKRIFNVRSLDTDSYARSLGLAVPPRIRFLQKLQKKVPVNNEKHQITSKLNENDDAGVNHFADSSSDEYVSGNDRFAVSTKSQNDKFDVSENDGDSDNDDLLTLKRKNIDVDAEIPVDDTENSKEKRNTCKKKVVTKAAVVKRILKKKIVPNKKTTFNEEGEKVIDTAKTKVSELAKHYENEADSGINIEIAKQVLREEDRYDKQRFKEKVKEKHREEKRKLKAKRKAAAAVEASDVEGETARLSDDSDELSDSRGVYDNEKQRLESVNSSIEDPQSNSDGDEIHRPPKRRKLTAQEVHKKKRTKRKAGASDSAYLKAEEELALQLLQG